MARTKAYEYGIGRERSGSTWMARATGSSKRRVVSSSAHTKPTGRTAYHPPAQFRSEMGSTERARRAPIRRYPIFSACLSGLAYTGDAIFSGATFGPSAGGTGVLSTKSNGISSTLLSRRTVDERAGASIGPGAAQD